MNPVFLSIVYTVSENWQCYLNTEKGALFLHYLLCLYFLNALSVAVCVPESCWATVNRCHGHFLICIVAAQIQLFDYHNCSAVT